MKLYHPDSLSEINVTSLVDVTLTLLIIFMITSPLMHMGLNVELPKAAAKAIETKENITITILKDATIAIDSRTVPLSSLPDELARALGEGRKALVVRADKSVAYGAVVKVLDTARKSGITQIGLVTELEEEMTRR